MKTYAKSPIDDQYLSPMARLLLQPTLTLTVKRRTDANPENHPAGELSMTIKYPATFVRESSAEEVDGLPKIFLENDGQLRGEGEMFWLLRLTRLVRLDPPSKTRDYNAKLIRRAILSTFLDCRAAGFEDLARVILLRSREPVDQPRGNTAV